MARAGSFVLLVGLFTVVTDRALAQGRESDRTEYDFRDADAIEGRRVPRPDDAITAFRKFPRHSLVQPRVSFVPELRETIEAN